MLTLFSSDEGADLTELVDCILYWWVLTATGARCIDSKGPDPLPLSKPISLLTRQHAPTPATNKEEHAFRRVPPTEKVIKCTT